MTQPTDYDAPLPDGQAALMRLFDQAYHTADNRKGRQAVLRDWHTVREALSQAPAWRCDESDDPRYVPCCTACVPADRASRHRAAPPRGVVAMKFCPYCWSCENPVRPFGPKHPCFTIYDEPVHPSGETRQS